MGSRWHRIFTEAYRFLAVGGLATVVAVVIFNFLVHGFHTGWDALLSGQPYLAFVIANLDRHGRQLPRQPDLGVQGPSAAHRRRRPADVRR